MGIEQIRMNQTKALPPAFQFNWSQMESDLVKGGLPQWLLESRSTGNVESICPISVNQAMRLTGACS